MTSSRSRSILMTSVYFKCPRRIRSGEPTAGQMDKNATEKILRKLRSRQTTVDGTRGCKNMIHYLFHL